jgi:hypothetical protein
MDSGAFFLKDHRGAYSLAMKTFGTTNEMKQSL